MDIVNIHEINHDLGYVGGDGILKSIASYLDRMVRTVDIVGRIGGSLFCLILPETGKEGSCRLIERIVQRLQDFVIDINSVEHRIKLELCFGGAEWRKVDEDLLERANHALKYAKENGLTYFFHGEDV